MHRVDSPDFIVVDGKRYYKETPTPATVFGHHQANAIQEEIADVIESEGITLRPSGESDAANNYKGQLNSAINKKITDAYNLSRNLNILPTSYPMFPVGALHQKDRFFIGVTQGIGLLKGVGSNADYYEEFGGLYPGGIGHPSVISFSRVFTDAGETWAQYNPANPDPDVGCVPTQASGWAGWTPQTGSILHVYLVKSPNFSIHTNRLMVVVDRAYPAPNNILSIDPSITHYMYAGIALVDNPGEACYIAPFIRHRYYQLWSREFQFTRLNFAENVVGTGTSFSQEHTVRVDCTSYGPVMVDLEVTLDYIVGDGDSLLDNVSEKVAVEISNASSGVNLNKINRAIQTNTKSVWNVRLGLINSRYIFVRLSGVGTLNHNHICEIRTIGFTIAERGM